MFINYYEKTVISYEVLDQCVAYGQTESFIQLVSETALAACKP